MQKRSFLLSLPASVGDPRQPGKWPSCPVWQARKIWVRPPVWKGASPRVVECCQVARKGSLREGVPRTGPQNRDFLDFCRALWSRGYFPSRAEALRVKAAPPLLSKALSDVDCPESLRCRLGAPLLTRDVARQGPWPCSTQRKGRGGLLKPPPLLISLLLPVGKLKSFRDPPVSEVSHPAHHLNNAGGTH